MMTAPNWIIASNELAHRGDRVRLQDGREGVIVRVSERGLPVVQLASGEPVVVHPQRIASRLT